MNLAFGIEQIRTERRADGVLAVAAVAVDVPPFPAGVHVLVGFRRSSASAADRPEQRDDVEDADGGEEASISIPPPTNHRYQAAASRPQPRQILKPNPVSFAPVSASGLDHVISHRPFRWAGARRSPSVSS